MKEPVRLFVRSLIMIIVCLLFASEAAAVEAVVVSNAEEWTNIQVDLDSMAKGTSERLRGLFAPTPAIPRSLGLPRVESKPAPAIYNPPIAAMRIVHDTNSMTRATIDTPISIHTFIRAESEPHVIHESSPQMIAPDPDTILVAMLNRPLDPDLPPAPELFPREPAKRSDADSDSRAISDGDIRTPAMTARLNLLAEPGLPDDMVSPLAITDSSLPTLTIEEVERRALAASTSVEQSRLDAASAAAVADAALAAHYPRLLASGDLRHTGGQTLPNPEFNSHSITVRLEQVFFAGGKISAQHRQALARWKSAREALRVREDETRKRSRSLFISLHLQSGLVRAAERTEELAREHWRYAKILVESGVQPRQELIRAERRLNEAQMNIIDAMRRRDETEVDLLTMLHQDARFIPIAPELPPGSRALKDQFVDHAMANRPELARSEHDVAAAAEEIKVARAALYPVLTGNMSEGARAQFGAGADANWEAGLSLEYSFWDGGRRDAGIAAAEATWKSEAARREGIRRQVTAEVLRAVIAFNSAHRLLELATARIRNAEEDLRMTRLKFFQGLGTGTEVIKTEEDLSNAWQAGLRSRSESISAWYTLQSAAGYRTIGAAATNLRAEN